MKHLHGADSTRHGGCFPKLDPDFLWASIHPLDFRSDECGKLLRSDIRYCDSSTKVDVRETLPAILNRALHHDKSSTFPNSERIEQRRDMSRHPNSPDRTFTQSLELWSKHDLADAAGRFAREIRSRIQKA